jgi:hypothetical protein
MVKPLVCHPVNIGHNSNEPVDRRYIQSREQFRTLLQHVYQTQRDKQCV